nr:hypothetical protein [Tanacetum cinerariifolium]
MDLFNLIRASNLAKVNTGTRRCAANEVPLLTVTAIRVIEMVDPATAPDSSGVPSIIERSPLDFANENPSQQSTGGNGTEDQDQETVALEIPPLKIQNAPPNVLRLDHVDSRPTQTTVGGKSLASMGLGTGSTFLVPTSHEMPVDARENEINNLEAVLEVETDIKKTAKAKNTELGKELENLRALFLDLQVSNDRLPQQVSTLQAQVTREKKLKAAFEEFKQYEDDRVEKRCEEIDARLDALSIDFDEELYPHMLTAIACRRWVIGHELRLAVMKCGESTELRKYPMVDQLELLKDAPIDVIPVYLEVRDPKDPWAFKEEILLADAIAANCLPLLRKVLLTSEDGASPKLLRICTGSVSCAPWESFRMHLTS